MAPRVRKAESNLRAETRAQAPDSATFAAAVEAAKLKSLYQFAYGLSHEINNPLTNIATRAQTLMVDEQDPERRRKLATIVQQSFRAHEMIADLMLFANPPEMQPENTDLTRLVEKVTSELKSLAQERKVRLKRSASPEAIWAAVDPVQIAVALKAVAQNACEAVSEQGVIEISVAVATKESTGHKFEPPHRLVGPHAALQPQLDVSPVKTDSHSPTEAGSWVCLAVKDNGPGIPASVREHIFDPYFSGREAGRGLGLGLSKAWRIVDLHGGRIEVNSRDGATEVRLLLPTNPA